MTLCPSPLAMLQPRYGMLSQLALASEFRWAILSQKIPSCLFRVVWVEAPFKKLRCHLDENVWWDCIPCRSVEVHVTIMDEDSSIKPLSKVGLRDPKGLRLLATRQTNLQPPVIFQHISTPTKQSISNNKFFMILPAPPETRA